MFTLFTICSKERLFDHPCILKVDLFMWILCVTLKNVFIFMLLNVDFLTVQKDVFRYFICIITILMGSFAAKRASCISLAKLVDFFPLIVPSLVGDHQILQTTKYIIASFNSSNYTRTLCCLIDLLLFYLFIHFYFFGYIDFSKLAINININYLK